MQLSQPFWTYFAGFWSSFALVLVSSAIIARLLSRDLVSLSESRKRGCMLATAEKSEQRLLFCFNCSVFGHLFYLWVLLPLFCLFSVFCVLFKLISLFIARLLQAAPVLAVRMAEKGPRDVNSGKKGQFFCCFFLLVGFVFIFMSCVRRFPFLLANRLIGLVVFRSFSCHLIQSNAYCVMIIWYCYSW